MRDRLLISWLALLGASRIDLLGGEGPFLLTPFLVLSPILVASELWRSAREGWELRVPEGTGSWLLTVGVLMALLLVSTFGSLEPGDSARRYALLLVQVAFVFLGAMALVSRPDPERFLLRGAFLGLGLSLAFSAAQLAVWVWEGLWPEAIAAFVDLEPGIYFGVVPRLTGLSHDPNLGGLLIVVYLALIVLLQAPSRLRSVALTLGAAAIVLTLSRSAVLAGLVVWGGTLWLRWGLRVTPGWAGAGAALAALATALFLFVPAAIDPVLELGEILGHRLTIDEGSASEHALLLARGWEVGTANVKQALVGIGYGNAYVVVQDVFPGNDYGNFHSLFLTLFAEAGVVAALVALGIFVHPLVNGGPYRPLIAGLLAFNLFQQAHTEPVLWLVLLLAWTAAPSER